MDITTPPPPTALSAYRPALYACFTRARDALFDLCDALATHPGARSFVELSQASCFRSRCPSVYEALEDGRIDRAALCALFAATARARRQARTRSWPWTAVPSRARTRARPPTARWCIGPPPGKCRRRTRRRCAPAGLSPRWSWHPRSRATGRTSWTTHPERPDGPHRRGSATRRPGAHQQTAAFKEQYAAWAGVEGSLSQGVRVCDLRQARYRGLAKTIPTD